MTRDVPGAGPAVDDDPSVRLASVMPFRARKPDDSTRLAELMEQTARGHEDAFSDLYKAISPRVYGLVLRIVRDPALSAEVTQEVFVELWTHAARYDQNAGSVMNWVLTITHRRAVDRVRREQRARERDTRYIDHNIDVEYDEVSENVERKLDAERVRKALDHLTDLQREAVRLAYFAGYTHSEVSRLLNVPLGTVKTRVRDGLIRLRDAMEEVQA
ncbi:MAG TPA: ECF RNA polymerase sigma factor SigK [Actinopolymorphaceae bacterium]|jgi:RNA polymerase sigma-70 factor (ECF subfamily)